MSSSPPVGPRRPHRGLVAAVVGLTLLGAGALAVLVGLIGRGGEPVGRSGPLAADSHGEVPAPAGGIGAEPDPPPVLLVRRIGELPGAVLRRARAFAGARVSVGLARRVA
ncbi:MAG: hypothetical protein M3088_04755, partial [Actinomycetota bacterium]|nr:hypothetical protein [Actinomycetota bacterium]